MIQIFEWGLGFCPGTFNGEIIVFDQLSLFGWHIYTTLTIEWESVVIHVTHFKFGEIVFVLKFIVFLEWRNKQFTTQFISGLVKENLQFKLLYFDSQTIQKLATNMKVGSLVHFF